MGKTLIIKGADFSQNGIVPDFIQLDWIEGSDTNGRGILSNILNKATLSMEVVVTCWKDANATVSHTSTRLPGENVNILSHISGWAKSTALSCWWGNGAHNFSQIYDNKKHTIFISQAKMKLDNTEYIPETQPTWSNGGRVMGLDCAYINSSSGIVIGGLEDYPSEAKIYIHETRIWDGATLVLDVIPVKRTADNIVCFYDKVQDLYFERNDGSTPNYGTLS